MILKERCQSNERACRIASGICNELGCLKVISVELRDSVNRFCEELRIRVGKLIGLLISSKILISEVTAVVYNLCACLEEFGYDLCGYSVGSAVITRSESFATSS